MFVEERGPVHEMRLPCLPRPLFHLPGSPLDNGGPGAFCFVRGAIHLQAEFDGSIKTTMAVGESEFSIEAEGEVAESLGKIHGDELLGILGEIRQYKWHTHRDGPRERYVIKVTAIIRYGQQRQANTKADR